MKNQDNQYEMNKLNEQMWSVAKEYARLFGEVIGMEPEFWVGDCPVMCCFGDTMFFSLEDMRKVIDNLPRYIRRYGSRKAVGREIEEWVNWWLDGIYDDITMERILPRVTQQLRVNISLVAWLDGYPREGCKPFSGPDADFLRLLSDKDTLSRLIREYGPDRELKVVLADVKTLLEREAAEKKKRDAQDMQKFMGRVVDNPLEDKSV